MIFDNRSLSVKYDSPPKNPGNNSFTNMSWILIFCSVK